MNSRTKAKDGRPARDEGEPQSMLLAMLDSLSDALDKKADDVEDSGESDGEVRASTLRDVATAIRERFAL